MLCAYALRADLAEEVDLDGGVYGYHVVVLTDDRRIVDIVNRQDGDGGVIVDIVVYPLRAVGEGRDGLAAVYLLAAVVDRAALDKLDHGVGEQFGVDAEVVLGFERHARRVGYRADAELDAGAVGYLLGDDVAYRLADGVDLCRSHDGQRCVVLDKPVNAADVHLSAADGAGLEAVDLEEHTLRAVEQRLGVGIRGGEAEISVLVHRRDGEQHDVILVVLADELGNVAVVGRKNIRPAAVYRSARSAA